LNTGWVSKTQPYQVVTMWLRCRRSTRYD